jgi:hydrogenase nickel incorporation protein HypA/HybF
MHELSICKGILEAARSSLEALASPPPQVSHVTVRIGRLTGVVPDSLRYYFELLTPGSPLEGAALMIEEIPIRGLCADCNARFEIETLSFTCPLCGSGFVELLTGRELQVVSIDTVDAVDTAQGAARGN